MVSVPSSLRPRTTPFHCSLPYLGLSVSASKAMLSPAAVAVYAPSPYSQRSHAVERNRPLAKISVSASPEVFPASRTTPSKLLPSSIAIMTGLLVRRIGHAMLPRRRARANAQDCVDGPLGRQLGEQAVGDDLEARGLAVGTRQHHRALQGSHQGARDLARRTGELQLPRPAALFQDPDEPALVLVEEMLHVLPHRLRQRAELGR